MTSRAVLTPAAPLAACALAHHTPGSRVAWHQWDTELGRMRHYTGRVTSHVRRRLTIAVDPDGRRHETECGHVAPPRTGQRCRLNHYRVCDHRQCWPPTT